MSFSSCENEGTGEIQCDWNDPTGQACVWNGGNNDNDRAACKAYGKDTGSMTLNTKATAFYGGILHATNDRNKGMATATGTLKAANWETASEKYVDGNTTIATKAGGIHCEEKPTTFTCNLGLTPSGPPTVGCGLGLGISCITRPPKGSVAQEWKSEIQSTSTRVDISYSGGGNSRSIGGKGVKAAGQAYAKNDRSYLPSGWWWLQGSEAKVKVRSELEINLQQVEMLRGNPNPNVTTTCTKVSPPESSSTNSTIRLSCGERLLK